VGARRISSRSSVRRVQKIFGCPENHTFEWSQGVEKQKARAREVPDVPQRPLVGKKTIRRNGGEGLGCVEVGQRSSEGVGYCRIGRNESSSVLKFQTGSEPGLNDAQGTDASYSSQQENWVNLGDAGGGGGGRSKRETGKKGTEARRRLPVPGPGLRTHQAFKIMAIAST